MRRTRTGIALASLLALSALGCRPNHHPTHHEGAYDRIATASFDSAGGRTENLPSGAYRWRPWWGRSRPTPPPAVVPPAPHSKIDARLLQWLADSSLTRIDTLVVTYVDTVTIARFPELDPAQSKVSAFNSAALVAAQAMVANLASRRAAQYALDSTDLVNNLSGQLLERTWITQAMRVRMPLGMIDSLATRPNVVWVQLDHTGIEPPTFADHDDNNSANDPLVGRATQATDGLFSLQLPYGWISVLDTGVLPTHEFFNESMFERIGDCVNGDASCNGGNPQDVTKGHGTATCAILAARAVAYPSFRGVTGGKLDVFRVYRKKGSTSELVVSAALRGFQTATARLDRVIVAEMQDTSSPAAAIAAAADGAFDAGAAVIAANGNSGPPPSALSYPACARRVIGVGARSVTSGATLASESYGLTADRRQKPDLQATSLTETAGSEGYDDSYPHTGTSGATPYAAGAASLLRNWLTSAQGSLVDPGQVYAQLILAGTNRGAPWPQSEGVGQIVQPKSGFCKFGKIQLTAAYPSCTIPIAIPVTGSKQIDVALWWPELTPPLGSAADLWHNDIDGHLIDPRGIEQASAVAVDGVWDKCGFGPTPVPIGTWNLRIDSKRFGHLPQVVYWTVAVR